MATFQSADLKIATLLNNEAKIVSNWYKIISCWQTKTNSRKCLQQKSKEYTRGTDCH